jgi:hypothetical protein
MIHLAPQVDWSSVTVPQMLIGWERSTDWMEALKIHWVEISLLEGVAAYARSCVIKPFFGEEPDGETDCVGPESST